MEVTKSNILIRTTPIIERENNSTNWVITNNEQTIIFITKITFLNKNLEEDACIKQEEEFSFRYSDHIVCTLLITLFTI